MKNIFEVSTDFLRKIEQFFMNKFLHSKFPKMRWICGMSRAVHDCRFYPRHFFPTCRMILNQRALYSPDPGEAFTYGDFSLTSPENVDSWPGNFSLTPLKVSILSR